ncbi:hypothetical protein evm_007706 [Chilo suppressalis]|nr:hypothetical protein evm_007706 [Chilo suppressalis]
MLIRTVGGDSWTVLWRGRAARALVACGRRVCVARGCRAGAWSGVARAVGTRGLDARGGLAPCGGSAAARPSGGRALVRSRLCAPFALHCKYLLIKQKGNLPHV